VPHEIPGLFSMVRRRNGGFVFGFTDTVITETELRELQKDRKLSLPFGNTAPVFRRQRATSRYEARVFLAFIAYIATSAFRRRASTFPRHGDKLQRLC